MILLLVVEAALLYGILCGGDLRRPFALPWRWPFAPLLAFATQCIVIYFPSIHGEGFWSLHRIILFLTYFIFMLTIWVNRRFPGMYLIGLGMVLNLVVMLAHGGYMPITPEAVQQIGHDDRVVFTAQGARVGSSKDLVLPKEQTHLWALSDVFVLPPPFPIPTAFSLGDVLIAVGAFVLIQYALQGKSTPTTGSPAGPGPVTAADVRVPHKDRWGTLRKKPAGR